MCGREQIRFVHVMRHPEFDRQLAVGCVCAEKLSDDYVGPRRRETELRNRATRRVNFPRRKWKTSKNGNAWLEVDGYHVVVFQGKYGGWFFRLDGVMSSAYQGEDAAKLGAFDRLVESEEAARCQ
jgi:hypothetical protein